MLAPLRSESGNSGETDSVGTGVLSYTRPNCQASDGDVLYSTPRR